MIANNNGTILANFTDNISSIYGPFGVIGRLVILHQLQDDLGLANNSASLSTGNSGKI
jgi:Cu-Zn family superoxide dismutase